MQLLKILTCGKCNDIQAMFMKFRDDSLLRCHHNNTDASGLLAGACQNLGAQTTSGPADHQNLTAFHVSAYYCLVMKGDMNSNIKLCPEYQSNFMRFLAS